MAPAFGDGLDVPRQFAGNRLDLLERIPRPGGELRTLDDVGGASLHRIDGLGGIGLNRLDQRLDLVGRTRRTFGESLHLVGHEGETAAGLTGSRGLDCGIEGEDTGLVGDVTDQPDDFADLLRGFAESLDALGGLLDLFADRLHAIDGATHGFTALGGDRHRIACDIGRGDGAGRDLFDRFHHVADCCGRRGDFPGLVITRVRKVHGRRLGAIGRVGNLLRSAIDRLDQFAQGSDGVVHGVGDRARDVLGHGGVNGEVALGEVRHFIQQPQDRFLITPVLPLGLVQTALNVAEEKEADDDEDDDRGDPAGLRKAIDQLPAGIQFALHHIERGNRFRGRCLDGRYGAHHLLAHPRGLTGRRIGPGDERGLGDDSIDRAAQRRPALFDTVESGELRGGEPALDIPLLELAQGRGENLAFAGEIIDARPASQGGAQGGGHDGLRRRLLLRDQVELCTVLIARHQRVHEHAADQQQEAEQDEDQDDEYPAGRLCQYMEETPHVTPPSAAMASFMSCLPSCRHIMKQRTVHQSSETEQWPGPVFEGPTRDDPGGQRVDDGRRRGRRLTGEYLLTEDGLDEQAGAGPAPLDHEQAVAAFVTPGG